MLKPLAEISFGDFLLKLFKAARQFEMEVQPQLVLLQKTLLNIEGLGRTLDPKLDLWATAKPFIENWMDDQFGVAATLGKLIERAPEIALELPLLPELLVTGRRSITRFERDLSIQRETIAQLRLQAESSRRKSSFLRILGALLVVGAGVYLWPLAASFDQSVEFVQLILGTSGLVAGLMLLLRG